MTRLVGATRYLIIIPIIGLALASAVFFVFGGFGLIRLLVESILGTLGLAAVDARSAESIPLEVEILEYVHQFLIGTVLYITGIGFFQLFIHELPIPGWLRINSTEELETNLVGVIVVVLAVNFLGFVFTQDVEVLVRYGAAISLPIAALALFIGLRTWSSTIAKKAEYTEAVRVLRDSSVDETTPALEMEI